MIDLPKQINQSLKSFQLRDGSFTDEWVIVLHITAFHLYTNIHITESNPYTFIARSNNLDIEL
jgi:hypothetical protein